MKQTALHLLTLLAVCAAFTSCGDDDDTPTSIDVPATYAFARDGQSTVSFSGQTDRLAMVSELGGEFKEFSTSIDALENMYANPDGVDPFEDASLNSSTKSVRGKTAASALYFANSAASSNAIKATFDSWIEGQIDEVFPANQQVAEAGTPGQLADGSSTRYVNAKGLEYDQAFIKGLIGALALDQCLNNYLTTNVLDEASNIADNDNGTVADGKSYTTMEHKWDEGYGYVFGGAANGATPLADLGDGDALLNKYLGRVNGDSDFSDYGQRVYDAFKTGRAAIVAKDYAERDEQARILRGLLSDVIGIRAVYYLQQAKSPLASSDWGSAFHDLSEGYGFIYSLQFTQKPETAEPYFTNAEVTSMLNDLMDDGDNGLWDVSASTLDVISNQIADRFSWTLDQAAN